MNSYIDSYTARLPTINRSNVRLEMGRNSKEEKRENLGHHPTVTPATHPLNDARHVIWLLRLPVRKCRRLDILTRQRRGFHRFAPQQMELRARWLKC